MFLGIGLGIGIGVAFGVVLGAIVLAILIPKIWHTYHGDIVELIVKIVISLAGVALVIAGVTMLIYFLA